MTAARKLWTDEHQRQLKGARLAAGVSDVAFARDNVITLRHLQQLEEGGSTAFYSESIKYDMGTKLLKRLGVEPRVVVVETDAPVQDVSAPTPVTAAVVEPPAEVPSAASVGDDVRAVTRMPYVVLSLVGMGLLGAGISLIPSIHQPGATQGVVQTSVADVGVPAPTPVIQVVASDLRGDDKSSDSAPASPAVTDAGTTATRAMPPVLVESCDQGGTSQTIVPTQPSKAADYVYLTAVSEVSLCVRDASGHITRKSLQAGQSFNIPGRQPFDVTADKLDQLRVFFQGQRIWFQADATRLRLTAATASD